MKIFKIISLFIILISVEGDAQFSLGTFLSDSLTKPISFIKQDLASEKFTENTEGKFDRITYYSWLNPVSIKIDLMFKKDGNFAARSISNANNTKEDGEKLFDIIYSVLIKNYGKSMMHRSLLGVEMFEWAGAGGSLISLSRQDEQTRLQIMVFK
jgi:hypothetical protein